MLVCHKWHAVASEAPSLWTDIDLVHLGTFAPVLLHRSRGASIRLYGCLRRSSTPQTIITDNATRIRELDIFACCNVYDPNPVPVLRAILAVNLPRVHVLSVSSGYGTINGTGASVSLINTPACLPVVKAMFLENTILVPAHVLPQLTHLCLAGLDNVEISNILDLLRNTPTLESLDIERTNSLKLPHYSAAASLSVSLPRLHSVCISGMTSATTGHHLLAPLEAPNLAVFEFQRFTVSPRDGILASMPLFPSTLTTRTINRLAFDFGDRDIACTAHHDNDLSLLMSIAIYFSEAEKRAWLFDGLSTMLPLPDVEEFHFQAFAWDVAMDLLPRLAARMPMVSTLFLKHHDARHDAMDEPQDGAMDLASVAVTILKGDALFPNLAHLELIADVIPLELCDLLAPALAQRDRNGRRLRTLRIRVDSEHSSAWKERWTHGEPEPNYEETGIFDHVDSGAIYPRQRGDLVCGDGSDAEEDPSRLGWGKWKDSVQRVDHGYWKS